MLRHPAAAMFLLLMMLFGRASYAAEFCDTLTVKNAGDMSGDYERVDDPINGAPVYHAYNTAVPEDSEFAAFYLYRHRVAFTASGFVWVLQPVPPDTEVWLAANYGEGDQPQSAVWLDGVSIECGAQTTTTADDPLPSLVPRSVSTTLDLMVVYTLEAARASRASCVSTKGLAESRIDYTNFQDPDISCGIRKKIGDMVTAFRLALLNSGLKDFDVRLVHMGGTFYQERPVYAQAKAEFEQRMGTNRPTERAHDQMQALINNVVVNNWKSDASLPYLRPSVFDPLDKWVHVDELKDYADKEKALQESFERNEIHARRQAFGADLVHLVYDPVEIGVICGIGLNAVTSRTGTDGTKTTAVDGKRLYSLTKSICGSHKDYRMAHEIGHNMGLEHDRETQLKGKFGDARRNLEAKLDQAWNVGYIDMANKFFTIVGSSRVDLQACKLEYSIVSPK